MVSLCSWKRTCVGSSPELKRKDSDWELVGRCYRAEPWSPGPIWGTIRSPIHMGCSLNHRGNQTISTTSVVLNSGPQTFLQHSLELSQPSKSWVSSISFLNFSFFFFWLKDLLLLTLLTQLDFGSRQLFLPFRPQLLWSHANKLNFLLPILLMVTRSSLSPSASFFEAILAPRSLFHHYSCHRSLVFQILWYLSYLASSFSMSFVLCFQCSFLGLYAFNEYCFIATTWFYNSWNPSI